MTRLFCLILVYSDAFYFSSLYALFWHALASPFFFNFALFIRLIYSTYFEPASCLEPLLRMPETHKIYSHHTLDSFCLLLAVLIFIHICLLQPQNWMDRMNGWWSFSYSRSPPFLTYTHILLSLFILS